VEYDLIKVFSMNPGKTYLVVDAGSSKIKLVLSDEIGRFLYRSEIKTPEIMFGADGSAHIRAEEYWKLFCDLCIETASAKKKLWLNLEGVCVVGQGDGLWFVDKNGTPSPYAIGWQDLRGKQICNDSNLIKLQSDFHCNSAMSGSRAILLAWLKQNQPDLFDSVSLPLQCVNWINYRLSGISATDSSNCGDAFDIKANKHIFEIYQYLGIEELFQRLPSLLACNTVIGNITPEASMQTLIPVSVPVFNGCVDSTAVIIGSMCSDSDMGILNFGTNLLYMNLLERPISFPLPTGVYVGEIPGEQPSYYIALTAETGAFYIDKKKEELFPNQTYEEMYNLLLDIPAGSNGFIFIPSFNGKGPYQIDRSQQHESHFPSLGSSACMMRATVEGVIYAIKHRVEEKLENLPKQLLITGGASRSDFLCQMIADIFEIPVLSQNTGYSGALGGLAIMGIPVHSPEKLKSYNPQKSQFPGYRQAYDKYCDLACKS
jgi:sugar (pentulose or hexulose) kinase